MNSGEPPFPVKFLEAFARQLLAFATDVLCSSSLITPKSGSFLKWSRTKLSVIRSFGIVGHFLRACLTRWLPRRTFAASRGNVLSWAVPIRTLALRANCRRVIDVTRHPNVLAPGTLESVDSHPRHDSMRYDINEDIPQLSSSEVLPNIPNRYRPSRYQEGDCHGTISDPRQQRGLEIAATTKIEEYAALRQAAIRRASARLDPLGPYGAFHRVFAPSGRHLHWRFSCRNRRVFERRRGHASVVVQAVFAPCQQDALPEAFAVNDGFVLRPTRTVL
jgi:hypothetical protein